MVTMHLDLKIDAQKFMQQVQVYNQEVEQQVQEGLDEAMKELADSGMIKKMIADAVQRNVMDSFSRWVFQSDIRKRIEKGLTEKLSERIDAYTDALVKKIADEMNLPE